jgi:Ca2+-binding RTX toxin-like protein
MAPVSDKAVPKGKPFELRLDAYTFMVVDVGDALSYTATGADGEMLPSWLIFDPVLRSFHGTPMESGSLDIRFIATDSAGNSKDSMFRLTVEGTPLHIIGTDGQDTIHGQGENDILSGEAGDDRLYGHEGDDLLIGGDGDDLLDGSAGNDTLYGADGNDILEGGGGGDTLYGGPGNDRLNGGAGNDDLFGERGGDTYFMYRGMGKDKINDMDSTFNHVDVDTLQIAADISVDQLWFRNTGFWDLEVSVIGTNDSVTIQYWGNLSTGDPGDSSQHIEQFKTADGKVLLDTQVNQLVQAMAAFAPPPAGQTTLPPDYQAALAPVLAANWR